MTVLNPFLPFQLLRESEPCLNPGIPIFPSLHTRGISDQDGSLFKPLVFSSADDFSLLTPISTLQSDDYKSTGQDLDYEVNTPLHEEALF